MNDAEFLDYMEKCYRDRLPVTEEETARLWKCSVFLTPPADIRELYFRGNGSQIIESVREQKVNVVKRRLTN